MSEEIRKKTIGRREVLKTAMASAAVVAGAGSIASSAYAAKGGNGGGKPGGGGGGTSTRNPLYIPEIHSPVDYSITAEPGLFDHTQSGGPGTEVLTYNGLMPGPTFVLSRGLESRVRLTNGLDEETTIHWHGMVVDTPVDGHPSDAVHPGQAKDYNFPVIQRAAMNWYHPHPHTLTGKQVNLGLAGGYLIRDLEEEALGLPTGSHEVPLILRDALFDRGGNLNFKTSKSGFKGTTPLVNGTLEPRLDVDTALYRFRMLNGANARVFKLVLSNGAPFTVIGNDGGLLEAPVDVAEITISGGERLDLLVDFGGLKIGDTVMLQDLTSGWDMLEFNVTALASSSTTVPAASAFPTIDKYLVEDAVMVREFSFDGMNRINGLEYDMQRIDFRVPRNQLELWRFTTGGNAPHPVHVHGTPYQVVSRSGGRNQLFPWEAGWKDTVLLDDGETIEILIKFEDFGFNYPAEYLIHCHKLSHEDAGMMLNFEVT